MLLEPTVNHICDWLYSKALSANKKGFAIGISGGIDSAVVSTLCAKTSLEVLCVSMPINQAPDQLTRAHEHCEWLKSKWSNVSAVEIDLTTIFDTLKATIPAELFDDLAAVNSRSRLRMVTLYAAANAKNLLVGGTGNRIEDMGIGFFTKYGDGGVDLSPIGGLLKTQVFEVAKYLEVIDSIQKAKPTDGLWGDNRSDEDQIGATYPELEWAMGYCEITDLQHPQDLENHILSNARWNAIAEESNKLLTDRQKAVLEIYLTRHWSGRHKMSMPPICEIPTNYMEA
jgi:NAD+ synthase